MSNEEQREYWNDQAGPKWVEHRARLDGMLNPVTAILVDAINAQSGERILDIGCGSGELSRHLAAADASITGIDLSGPLVEAARSEEPKNTEFMVADASQYRGDAPFDKAVSRFGVMFFEDPTAAFANIHGLLAPGGRLTFASWCAPAKNAWAMVPAMAVMPLLPESPPAAPHAPGPFAFADDARVRAILEDAGFGDITLRAHDVTITMSDGGGLEDATNFACQIGPGAKAMGELDKDGRATARAAIRDALVPHVGDDGTVALAGGIWLTEARA